MSSEPRPYHSALRTEQREQTRQRLLDAFRALLDEGRTEVTLPQVARQAGVSPATAYKHFASLEALVDAYWRLPGINVIPQALDDREALLRLPGTTFDVFEGSNALLSLIDALGGRSPLHAHGRRMRTDQYLPLAAALLGEVPAETRHLVPRLLRHLNGSRAWLSLKHDMGLTTPEITKLVTWAIATLLAELDRNPRSLEDFRLPEQAP